MADSSQLIFLLFFLLFQAKPILGGVNDACRHDKYTLCMSLHLICMYVCFCIRKGGTPILVHFGIYQKTFFTRPRMNKCLIQNFTTLNYSRTGAKSGEKWRMISFMAMTSCFQSQDKEYEKRILILRFIASSVSRKDL